MKPRTLNVAELSDACKRLNPHLCGPMGPEAAKEAASSPTGAAAGTVEKKRAGKRRKEMNKLETEFARLLEAKRLRGEIVSWDYEGLTLRWPDGMAYTGDFLIVTNIERPSTATEGAAVRYTVAEVKGYSWAKDIVKWRAARANWPLYRFEFWERIDGEWQQTR